MTGVVEKVAAFVYPNGGILTCGEGCGATRWIDASTVAHYLATGWPVHCGQTVTADPAPRTPGR